MPKTVKQPTIIIPIFTGTTAQEFRAHKLQLDTIFYSLQLLKVFDGTERFLQHRSRRRQKLYDEKSRQVNQILTQSFSKVIQQHQLYLIINLENGVRIGKN